MMSAIYKIISPSKKIYIGQSININKRITQYKNYRGNTSSIGPILLNSFQKYGWEDHTFEIIEECNINLLNIRETYWKQYYLNILKNDWNRVLFCGLYDSGGGPKTPKTKHKMSISQSQNLLKPEILNKRLINCKNSSTQSSHDKRLINTNWEDRNKKLKKPRTYYKIFYKIDLEDNILETYYSIKDILGEFNNPKPQNLYSCLKGIYNTWMGYKWKGIK